MSELEKSNLDYCFPTPVMCHVWANSGDLNKELRRLILAREREDPGRSRSNVSGWHSETGMLEWCGDAGKALIERCAQMANHATNQLLVAFGRQPAQFTWTFQAWANVNRAASFNKTHTHPGATWSGTYYIDPGNSPANADHGTPLQLIDPCLVKDSTFFPGLIRTSVFVHPEPGMMILFPSYVPHMVFAHRGDQPRISIAFNLRKEPYP